MQEGEEEKKEEEEPEIEESRQIVPLIYKKQEFIKMLAGEQIMAERIEVNQEESKMDPARQIRLTDRE